MTARPVPLAPIFANIPGILTTQPSWVMWCYVFKDGKHTKVPKQVDGSYASTNNPATWNTFDNARAAYQRGGFDGVGIVLTGKPLNNGLYLIGLDFDHCLTASELDHEPRQAIELLNTYSEISPSGEGIRLFLLHDKPVPARKISVARKSREIYSAGRYLTVTGHTLDPVKDVRHVA